MPQAARSRAFKRDTRSATSLHFTSQHERDSDLYGYPTESKVDRTRLRVRRQPRDAGHHFRDAIRIPIDHVVERRPPDAAFRQVPPGLAPDCPHDRLYHGVAQPQTASIRSGSSCFLGQRPIVSAGPHPAASSVHSTSMIDTSSVAAFVPADCDIDRRDSAVRAWKATPVMAMSA